MLSTWAYNGHWSKVSTISPGMEGDEGASGWTGGWVGGSEIRFEQGLRVAVHETEKKRN